MNYILRVCDTGGDFLPSLLKFWAENLLPVCVAFLLGLTIYEPIFSALFSSVLGIIYSLDIYTLLSDYKLFFAITMIFIKLCTNWIYLWYLSYVSSVSVTVYTGTVPLTKKLDYIFMAKYIVWFSMFACLLLLLCIAQCIMFRI
ncbi:MAG: hypothetical protein IJO74_07250 [Clostridia bacterium]|nr:hypothetical protein [Clostridia bacterium]